MPPLFIPPSDEPTGEETYEVLRKQTERDMGRPPSKRRIMELWTRRGNRDCVTTVGAPDPIWGDVVTAIFDMGPHQPFVIYRQPAGRPYEQRCEVVGCNAYSVTEFSA
ncbi:MAG: hypothetical protein ABI323_14875 [Solirubrobacteraceae bacterium]